MTLALPKTMTEIVFESTGILFGVKAAVSKDMTPYVREITPNGNPLFDPKIVLDRLDIAGKFIRKFSNPLVYATDRRFENALKCFEAETKIPTILSRLYAGSLSNPEMKYFRECDVILISDPTNGLPEKIDQPFTGDRRAMYEAAKEGIPVVAICNSNATFNDVDLAIPANNLGTRAIATIFYVIAASYLSNTPTIPLEAFETVVEVKEEEEDSE